MASYVFGSSSSSFVSQEEFKIFHSIDRELYTRLVVNIGRDPAESMQVMALWLWLERVGHDQNLVQKMLTLPDTFINGLAEEAVLCLNCIEQDEFLFSSEGGSDIPLIQSLTKSEVSLRFFHGNRLSVIREVTRIVNEVCSRAFEDIMRKVLENKSRLMGSGEENHGLTPGIFYGSVLTVPFYNTPRTGGTVNVPQTLPRFGQIDPRMVIEASVNSSEFSRTSVPYDLAIQRQIMNVELSELLSHINLTSTEEDNEIPPDDRTIFLTFSKGYPISENELRDFFAGKYGDCVDAIYMQEVQGEDQVLYARLVVRSASTIHDVLEGQNKAKFAINGKHVWARKYVRKQQATTPPSQPTSPAAAPPQP